MTPVAKLLLLLALSFPLAALAGAPASSAPATPAVVKQTLPNGLRVLVQPRRTAPVVTTMMWYRVGSRDELPGATGLAHFLEHLLFKGTRKLPKGAIDRITYQNGGSNNAFTFNDYTAYEFNLPKANWKAALAIEADRMRNSLFDKKEFEAERLVVMEERRGGEDEPAQQFAEQLNAMTFLVHPYRNPVIGWMDDLKRVSRDEVYSFYQKYYVPANCTLVITGDVTPEEALAAAREAFAVVPRLPAPHRRTVTEPVQTAARRLRLALPTQVARVQAVFAGVPRRSPDAAPLEVLQYALTEGKLSRLYRRLVDSESLAADVDGYLGAYRDAGEIVFYANAREGAPLDRLETVLWEELERIAGEPLAPQDLERATNQYQAGWIHGIDTANDLASALGEADALGGYESLEAHLARVQAVTAADVQRVARQYLRRDRSTVGHLYPQEGAVPKKGASLGPPRVAARGPAARSSARPVATVRRVAAVPFQPLQPVEKVLPNGLRLILLENHALPTVTLSARIDAGALHESDAEAGLANLAGRMLAEGAGARGHAEISAALEQVGASFTAAAGRASTYATLETLSGRTVSLLPLFAELLRAPTFPESRLEHERGRLLVELKEAADDAPTVARQAFQALVYGSHPAHRPVAGTEATVRSLTRDALVRFHRRYYRPDNTTLVAVGDFRTAEMLERLTQAFQIWERPADPLRSAPESSLERQAEPRVRRITMDKTQTQIVLGHLGVTRADPDYLALRVMDTILGEGVGGGFTARIPYQLRDVQGLAYGVGSSITSSAGKIPGLFLAVMGTEPKNEKAAVAALLNEIRRIRSTTVTPTELREAVAYLANSYVFDFQTNDQFAAYLHSVQYYGLDYNYRQQFVRDVQKVTRADVLRAAQKHLNPAHTSLVVVGPASPPVPNR